MYNIVGKKYINVGGIEYRGKSSLERSKQAMKGR